MTGRILQLSGPHILVPAEKVPGLLKTARILETAMTRLPADWTQLAPVDTLFEGAGGGAFDPATSDFWPPR